MDGKTVVCTVLQAYNVVQGGITFKNIALSIAVNYVQQNHQSSLAACCVVGVPLGATFTILNNGYVTGTVSDAQSGYSQIPLMSHVDSVN